MNKLEKLFTIADIAEMTSLSDRSIRNYLRNGLLTGQKIGGQWRFTSQDIMNFFHRSDVRASVTKQWKLDILDFIDGVNPASEGERQACTIVDLYLSREEADACNEKVSDYFSACPPSSDAARVHFEYSEKERRARFTLFSTPSIAAAVLNLLK